MIGGIVEHLNLQPVPWILDLQDSIQDPLGNGGLIPGGWPNGRRFGDDVIDIAVSALISDLRELTAGRPFPE